METSILNEFLVLEETNSFSKAAKQLRMSQATLSRHIMQLEEECKVTLFNRTTQKMKLTPYGESLVVYARAMLENERSFKRDVERIKFKSESHLVIGTVDFPYYYGITSLLGAFKKDNISATLDVRIESTDELVKLLRMGEIDVAFLRNIDGCAEEFESFLFAEDHMYLAIPAGHPLAEYESAGLPDFKDDVFYKRYAKNSYMDKLFTEMFKDAGFTPNISTSEGGWEDSVINDLNSVTTCTGGLAETFRGNVHVKVLDLKPAWHADVYLAKAPRKVSSEIVDNFMEYVEANKKSLKA